MYFPFHSEAASSLPPPGSWYREDQNIRNIQNHPADSPDERTDEEVSMQIALSILNELAELSAWIQSQRSGLSGLEATSHVTFDAEGRPVALLSPPRGGGPPAGPVFPPSYSRATADHARLPSLGGAHPNPNPNPYQTEDFQRFLSRYNTPGGAGIPYASPPPSYSRATSHAAQLQSEAQLLDRTPPPSYRRAVGDATRERPTIGVFMEPSQADS